MEAEFTPGSKPILSDERSNIDPELVWGDEAPVSLYLRPELEGEKSKSDAGKNGEENVDNKQSAA